jgi:hypothetical protein
MTKLFNKLVFAFFALWLLSSPTTSFAGQGTKLCKLDSYINVEKYLGKNVSVLGPSFMAPDGGSRLHQGYWTVTPQDFDQLGIDHLLSGVDVDTYKNVIYAITLGRFDYIDVPGTAVQANLASLMENCGKRISETCWVRGKRIEILTNYYPISVRIQISKIAAQASGITDPKYFKPCYSAK